MSRAVVVGERGFILGFKGVGMDVVPVETPETFRRELMRLTRQADVVLILVTESTVAMDPGALDDFRAASTAILTTIPTHQGSNHFGLREMRGAIERCIGVDMLGKD